MSSETKTKLIQESEALRAKMVGLKKQRRGIARAIELEESNRQAGLDLKIIGPERIAKAAQVLKAAGVAPGAIGTPGTK